MSSGSNNIAIGNNAGNRVLKTGSNNIAIGNMACDNVSGSNKICIGNDSGPNENDSWGSDSVERIFIGSTSNYNGGAAVLEVHNDATTNIRQCDDGDRKQTGKSAAVVINGNLVVKGYIYSSLYRIKDGDSFSLYGRSGGQMEPLAWSPYYRDNYITPARGGWGPNGDWYPSDKRLKYISSENNSGLDKIKLLRVINYTYKNDKAKTPRVGVIAQDLQKVFPDAVKKGDDGYLTIRWDDMFYALINAVKELDAKVSALIKNDNDKDARIKALENKNKILEAENNALEARLKRLEDKIK